MRDRRYVKDQHAFRVGWFRIDWKRSHIHHNRSCQHIPETCEIIAVTPSPFTISPENKSSGIDCLLFGRVLGTVQLGFGSRETDTASKGKLDNLPVLTMLIEAAEASARRASKPARGRGRASFRKVCGFIKIMGNQMAKNGDEIRAGGLYSAATVLSKETMNQVISYNLLYSSYHYGRHQLCATYLPGVEV